MALEVPSIQQIPAGQTKLDDYGQQTINTFALAASMKLQQQKAQEGIARINQAIAEHQDLLAHQNQEMGLRQQEFQNLKDYRREELKIRSKDVDNRWDQKKEQVGQYGSYVGALRGIHPDDPDAEVKFWDANTIYSAGAMTPGGRTASTQWWNRYNQNVVNKRVLFNASRSQWYGDPFNKTIAAYGLTEPEQWQTKYVLPDGSTAGDTVFDKDKYAALIKAAKDSGVTLNSETYKAIAATAAARSPTLSVYPDAKITTDKFASVGVDPVTKQAQYITRPAKLVDERLQQFKKLQENRRNLPVQQRIPAFGVVPRRLPTDQDNESIANEILRDPNSNQEERAWARDILRNAVPGAASPHVGPLGSPTPAPEEEGEGEAFPGPSPSPTPEGDVSVGQPEEESYGA